MLYVLHDSGVSILIFLMVDGKKPKNAVFFCSIVSCSCFACPSNLTHEITRHMHAHAIRCADETRAKSPGS